MRLIRAVIRILPQDHHFHVTKLGKAKGVKHIFSGRIDNFSGLTLAFDKLQSLLKVSLLLFITNDIMPRQ
ncbi:Uncharacterised protein [Vibrio cholerae]|nr:Uncharacterised protein [Vibrio cholerae]CSI61325.1 Uncharacterised protein [Vibrio cholerae]